MPYCQLYYHLVWTTKERQPLLAGDREPVVYDFLRAKATGLGGFIYALNGTDDHVHLVVSIPPRLALSDFIGQAKGVASARFNKLGSHPLLYWQEEYGAFTFDGKRLPNVIDYVERQKEHHAARTLIAVLERTDDQPIGLAKMREPSAIYATDSQDSVWWREMMELE
jgi:REP element-mobilizing transposase RayT